jgi:sugar phosphate permease
MTAAVPPGAATRVDLLRRYRLQLFAATWLSYAGFYVTRKVFSVVKVPIKAALHMDDLHVSHLFTAYLVTYMLGMFAAAWLGKRMTNRTQLLWGMGVSVGCNVVMGGLMPLGAPAYPFLMLTMAVHGLAQATGWPANVGLMANWSHRAERGTLMAAWGTCYQIGAVAAKAFAAFMFGWLGLLWSFWGSSLVLGAIWALFFFWGREEPESCGLPPIEEDPTPSSATSSVGDADHARPDDDAARRRIRLIIAMGVIYFSFKFLRYALDSWTVLILVERFGLTTSRAGYLSTSFDWIGFVGVLLAGFLSDKVFRSARAPVIFWMTLGSFFATVLLWLVGLTSVAAFVVILGLVGLLDMGPDSLLSGTGAIDAGSRKHATMAAGIINGLGSIGPIVQEPSIGWLKTRFGIDSVFFLLAAMTMLATVGTGLLWYNVRRYRLPL